MRKRFAAAMLALAMLCGFAGSAAAETHTHCSCGAADCTENTNGHTPITYEEITKPSTRLQGDRYVLGADINGNLVFENGGTVYLCLNGHTINGRNDTDAVKMSNGSLVLCDCNGSGSATGGVITHGTYTADDGTTQKYTGSGVYADDNVTIYGGTISGNTTLENGGGVYAYRGNVTIYGGTISGNTANNGGGVYAAKGVTIYGGTIGGNTADHGGGVYADDGIATISGGTIGGNTADHGGGVYASDGIATISGTAAISGNTAKYGGGVYAYKANVTISGGTIGGTNTGNTANQDGGGVYVNFGDVTVSGGTIGNNTAENDGGGVYASDGDVTVSGGTISGNTANSGGGVYADNGDVEISVGAISGNTASYGGGVNAWNGDVTVSGGTISGNEATWGGGVYALRGNVTIFGTAAISGNEATWGGGVHAHAIGTIVTISGGTISNNTTVSHGGGVCASHSAVEISGGTISGNTASGNGGGVYTSESNASVKISGGTIGDNEAQYGGGVYANNGDVTISGGTIGGTNAGNTANQDGGGVYANAGNVTISGGTISGNAASGNGGGVYTSGSDAIVTISGGTISGNTASGNGGGVYAIGGGVEISGTAAISGNTATNGQGGGVYAFNVDVEISGGEISGNTANSGGGVYAGGGDVTISGGEISGNTANSGGGVYATGGDVTVSGNAKVSGNGSGAAGNVYLPGGKKLILGGALTGGVNSIGVTTRAAPTSGGPVEYMTLGTGVTEIDDGSLAATFSDNAAYTVQRRNDKKSAALYVQTEYAAPVANPYLCYNGSEQRLITPGLPDAMEYAIGSSGTTAPAEGWAAEPPTGTDAGAYHIWYRVPGSDSYLAVAPQYMGAVTIDKTAPGMTAPTAVESLHYSAANQALVTAGSAVGGEMQYALGGTTVPAEGDWSTSIPQGTLAGTYNVWYRVKGDKNHSDTMPTFITVMIYKSDLTAQNVACSQTLWDSTPVENVVLSGKATFAGGEVLGEFVLDAGQTLEAGTKRYKWTFNMTEPDEPVYDVNSFNPLTGTIDLTVQEDTITSIALTTEQTKKIYEYGEAFDLTGAVVTATYASGRTADVTDRVTHSAALAVGQESVTLSCGGKSCTAAVTVGQATATLQNQSATMTVTNNRTFTYTLNLSQYLPLLADGLTYGGVTYRIVGPATDLSGYLAGAGLSVDDGVLSVPVKAVESSEVGEIGTIHLQLESGNYTFMPEHTDEADGKSFAWHLAVKVLRANKPANQAVPQAFTLSIVQNGEEESFTATIPAEEGCEYSFDGESWSDVNTKTDCMSGKTVTGYKRYKETEEYLASQAVTASATAPRLTVKTPKITAREDGKAEIACATNGASIYYTTDGSDPLAGGTLYTDAFEVKLPAVVRAAATCEGYENSAVVMLVFGEPEQQIARETLSDAHLTDELKAAGYAGIEQVAQALERIVVQKLGGGNEAAADGSGVQVWDVRLQFLTETGWIDATADNFPKGGITVVLPYPEGTAAHTHDFHVSHMFTVTSKTLGTTAGETEDFVPVELESGLQVTLTGLSPVAVGFKATPADASALPDTGDASSLMGWMALLAVSVAAGATGATRAARATGMKLRRKN